MFTRPSARRTMGWCGLSRGRVGYDRLLYPVYLVCWGVVKVAPMTEILFTASGLVTRGSELARMMGFPTANIPLDSRAISGTYAGFVFVDGQECPAAVYADSSRKILEAHILDFDGDLYGKKIEIRLVKKITDPQKFEGENELREFIVLKVKEVREYFKL